MKYLLLFALMALAVLSQDTDVNEDITRSISFEKNAVVEARTVIKFKPAKGTKAYYFVVPREYEHKLVNISATDHSNKTPLRV